MSMVKNGLRDRAFRFQNGAINKSPKTLLTLYQRKGLDVARVEAPSSPASLSARQPGS